MKDFEKPFDLESKEVTKFIEFYNRHLPYSNIDINSPEIDLLEINKQIEKNKQKYFSLEKFNSPQNVIDLRKDLNDFVNSYQFVLEKQRRLNNFRKN